jgi:hypothetical protein
MVIYGIEVKVRARTATVPWDVLKKSWLTSSSGKRLFQTDSGVQPASYSMGTDYPFIEGKADGE